MHRVNAIARAHVAQIEGGKGGSLELFYLLKTGQNTRKQEQHALAISSSR